MQYKIQYVLRPSFAKLIIYNPPHPNLQIILQDTVHTHTYVYTTTILDGIVCTGYGRNNVLVAARLMRRRHMLYCGWVSL